MLEKLTNMVPKWSPNLSKIDPGGALEATWEPPLKQGASKTSLLTIWAPFWDPHLKPVGGHLGHHCFNVFMQHLEAMFIDLGAMLAPFWNPFWIVFGRIVETLSKM